MSVQVCRANGTFNACQCGVIIDDPGSGDDWPSGNTTGDYSTGSGSNTSTSSGGSGTGDDAPQLSAGASKFIDVFPADAGIVIVLADALLLVDREGKELQRVDLPRDAISAAFDGTTLVIADGARFTTYDLTLKKLGEADLAEACASAVLVGGGRLVCGPKNDWDRVLYTYDISTGGLLASSDEYTYKGIPMRRIPGTDDFVTVTVNSSPSDFHLYSVLTSNEPVYVGESPYHGDFGVNNVYAFDGSPATHLITHEGLMLLIYGEKCNPMEGGYTAQCFVKDGALGTLSGAQRFVGMDSDAAGKLYGLVDLSPDWDETCKNGCLAERIDVASRSTETKKLYHLAIGGDVVARHDSGSDSLVVGYRVSSANNFPDDTYPGYKVVLLSYK